MHGVTAEYVREMRAEGLDGLSLGQLTEMRMHGVNSEYVREMRDFGVESAGVGREACDVSPAYPRPRERW